VVHNAEGNVFVEDIWREHAEYSINVCEFQAAIQFSATLISSAMALDVTNIATQVPSTASSRLIASCTRRRPHSTRLA
jgi:hypothetical protein